MTSIHELIRHLNNGQQADADGVMVTVSRHAVVEAIRLLNLLGETNDALSACQSETGGILRSIRGDIEAAYNGLDYLTSIHVATAADPNVGRQLAIDAAEIKGRLLQHMKRIDAVVTTVTNVAVGTSHCSSGEPHLPYSDDPTQCMVCGAALTADVCTWPACGCKRGSDHECAQGYARSANNG